MVSQLLVESVILAILGGAASVLVARWTLSGIGALLPPNADQTVHLTVQTPGGERYTRNGSLQINAQGQLVTSEGLQVVGQNGPIVFQPGDREISISTDGTVSVREGANTTDTQRGKMKFASFTDPRMLLKDGTSTFRPPDGMAVDTPTVVRINQGAIEKSNVRSVVEMTRMVEVTRTYTQVAQLLQQHSDMRRTAIQQLAEVPA